MNERFPLIHLTPKKQPDILISLLLGILLLNGCSPAVQASEDPTLQAKIVSFAQTATARSADFSDVNSPLLTAQAEATEFYSSVRATQTQSVQQYNESARSTATAAAPIIAELPAYDVDPERGAVAWIHPPISLEVDKFRSGDFANEFSTITASDFVLAADITWESEYGTSGCGFALRSNGDQDAANQYLVVLSRNANGHAYFIAQAEGKPANYRDFYANRTDKAFSWQNGGTNRLAVVGRGPVLWIYTNQSLAGKVDVTEPPPKAPDLPAPPVKPEKPDRPDFDNLPFDVKQTLLKKYEDELEKYNRAQEEYERMVEKIKSLHYTAAKNFSSTDSFFERGFFGLVAVAYSGKVNCTFENSWLWMIQ